MMKRNVYVFAVVHVKVEGVEGDTVEECAQIAGDRVSEFMGEVARVAHEQLVPSLGRDDNGIITQVGDAEQIVNYLVDDPSDPDYKRSVFLDESLKPVNNS
jgi:hypothetical protein